MIYFIGTAVAENDIGPAVVVKIGAITYSDGSPCCYV